MLGLELAIGSRSAEEVLLWSERWRALVSGAEPVAERPEVLVELVRDQDTLYAVVAHGDRLSLHDLGSLSSVTEAMVRIRYNLRRRNLRDTRPDGEEGLSPGLSRELAALDEVLIRPLDLPPEAVSVVPTAALHSLPWSLLPSLRGRAVSVAPSAAMAVANREMDGPVVALAGPTWPTRKTRWRRWWAYTKENACPPRETPSWKRWAEQAWSTSPPTASSPGGGR